MHRTEWSKRHCLVLSQLQSSLLGSTVFGSQGEAGCRLVIRAIGRDHGLAKTLGLAKNLARYSAIRSDHRRALSICALLDLPRLPVGPTINCLTN